MSKLTKAKLLVVEDDTDQRMGLVRLLSDAGYCVSNADCADKALGYMDEGIDIILMNLGGDGAGLNHLRHWKAKHPNSVFVILSGHGSIAIVVEAMQAGAYHYMTKPIDPMKLLTKLQEIVSLRAKANEESLAKLADPDSNGLNQKLRACGLVGCSQKIQHALDIIRRATQNSSAVLIFDEPGPNKRLIAKAIHDHSALVAGPFVVVDCSALLLGNSDTELFGLQNSVNDGAGALERARGGTLFIDQIDELPITMQVKLLSALEQTRGASAAKKTFEKPIRIITGASCSLHDKIPFGTFREDLYYRLERLSSAPSAIAIV